MPNPENNAHTIELTLLTPDSKPVAARCDSVHLPLADDLDGRGGGDYGVHPGHAPAILSLGPGKVRAVSGGTVVLEQKCPGGFAKVLPGSVKVITENISEI